MNLDHVHEAVHENILLFNRLCALLHGAVAVADTRFNLAAVNGGVCYDRSSSRIAGPRKSFQVALCGEIKKLRRALQATSRHHPLGTLASTCAAR